MYYRVKPCESKRRQWRILACSGAGPTRKEKTVPTTDYAALGVAEHMGFEEARNIIARVNTDQHRIRIEEMRARCKRRVQAEDERIAQIMDPIQLDLFEREVLFKRLRYAGDGSKKRSSAWRAAKRMIIEVGVEPHLWPEYYGSFYDFFTRHKYSHSYLHKVLPLANLWGSWVCRRRQKHFEPVPFPTGNDKTEIFEAHEAAEKKSKESAPLKSDQMYLLADMQECHRNWILITLWFGLRPREVDNLSNPELTQFVVQNGHHVLKVEQTKLRAMRREQRIKLIPVLFDEQRELLKEIKRGNYQRPCIATIHRHLGDDYTTYAGRKGFFDLMTSLGRHPLEISMWLGHQRTIVGMEHVDLSMTLRHYKDKSVVTIQEDV